MAGMKAVADAFRQELGIDFGQTTKDGRITLEYTACIGLSDQAPAALVNDVPVTFLTGEKVREIVATLKKTGDPKSLIKDYGDGNNAHPLVRSMVRNNIRKKGAVIFADLAPGAAIGKALKMSPKEVINEVKNARLRGRGGAGFPTGLKWEFTRGATGDQRYVLCNADEGEPGTFKDRAILTECPDLLLEGMTIAGYAIGAETGVLYLRAEYAYLYAFLQHVLAERRKKGLLGKNVGGKQGFNFDVRIQLGAGAYVCGEETALLSSCEGQRGEPRSRPPFPAQKGYLAAPTVINNVETYCCAARILDQGASWFAAMGSKGSPGTKLMSVSGDCKKPGVYEVPYGITVNELLADVAGEGAQAVQIGGPSGQCIGPEQCTRTLCYDDLATGGSIMVFGPQRDVLAVAHGFMEFFTEESCGWCTGCRVGNVLLKNKLGDILAGRGAPEDLPYLKELGETIKVTSRCGLGQTSANPVLTTLANFRGLYEARVKKVTDGRQPTFDLRAAVSDAVKIAGREPVHFED
jgi:[NiFe] hydrogenase diaphorase moiety large subunit